MGVGDALVQTGECIARDAGRGNGVEGVAEVYSHTKLRTVRREKDTSFDAGK
ncbi:hypothetical protein ZOD2009_02635 [Haladaptatus paucihalophilus DX253]|uniref:Uncharacterized protein n=1 Tax=Haladaptatus paucihalophilus DX253 TaxID=797209 RepID=E7QP88_HALPU|nr:hypothetical protein ZOD2009_02635 [Haladaptatus paucihalophilus DX253]